MIDYKDRYRPNQQYVREKFNRKVNSIKSINKTFNKRGGIKL